MKKTLLFIAFIAISVSSVRSQTILGVDVSHYQGTINWTSVKGAGYTFAWAKATEGVSTTDAEFVSNEVNGTAAGVVIGAYHFAHPETNSATAEANYFLSVAGTYINSCSLPPVLDLEDPSSGPSLSSYFTSSQLTSWVQLWITTVKNATGITPILYTNGNYAGYLNSSVASSCGLWIADPDGSSTAPPATTGVWTTWDFKQYSWTGTVPGIAGNVDMDVFNGNTAAFNVLVPCVTTPCSHIYTTLPYSTSFENTWITDTCSGGAQRVPDKYWSSSVGGTTPNGNDYWHRDDYTGTDWTSTTGGAYTPVASTGSYSARFHNDPSPAGSTGALDLYVNLSASGSKTISFDYIHNELSVSPFAFQVLLSTDSGATFPTTLLSIPAQVSSWTTETVTTTVTSAASVIRFIVTDKGVNDVGIDNLKIAASSGSPTASYTTTSSPVCAGSSITYTSTSTGSPTSYSWVFQNGTPATSTTSSQVVTYATAGTYTVSLTATNSSGSNTSTSTITVNPLPTITASASTSTVCSGTSTTLTGSGGSTYSWSTG
ncbi:MAG TPA: GH25 family lysozyme, partial [Bacteroidia bacterium]|nr:GH25 family lysozyme [Bacteroidia bacterium]